MVATVVVTVATHNLAIGVIVGVLTAMVIFARRVAHFTDVESTSRTPTRTPGSTPCTASCSSPPATTSSTSSTTRATPTDVVIDLTAAHIWDASTVAALDAISTSTASTARTSRSSA